MSTPQKAYCIDIEATCWEGRPPNKFPEQRNEIIEIGITPINLKTKQIEDSRAIIVIPPTTEISEFCTKLTTLTPEFIKQHGIPYKDAMMILEKEFRLNRNIFVSWGDYDRKSFEKNCSWNRVSNPIGNMNLNAKALFAAKYGWNGGLDTCAKELGFTFEGTHHRGVDDSRMVAKVFRSLMGWI